MQDKASVTLGKYLGDSANSDSGSVVFYLVLSLKAVTLKSLTCINTFVQLSTQVREKIKSRRENSFKGIEVPTRT